MLIPAGSARGRFNDRLRHAEAQRHVQIQIAGAVPGDQTDKGLRLLTIHIRAEQIRTAVQLLLAGKVHPDLRIGCKFQPVDSVDCLAGLWIITDRKCTSVVGRIRCFPQLMRAEQRIPIVNVQYDIILAVFSIDPFRVHRQRKGEVRLVFVSRLRFSVHPDGRVFDVLFGDDVGDVARIGRLQLDQRIIQRLCRVPFCVVQLRNYILL